MVRFLLWLFVIYFVWRLFSLVVRVKFYRPPHMPASNMPPSAQKPFSNVQEADFEDITPTDPSEKK
jgi:hypothetical protein